MPRPPAPCGTYPAYRRHLRKHESVDAACRRAQREHDAARSEDSDREPAPVAPIPPRPRSLEQAAEDLRLELLAKARAVVAAVEDGNPYAIIDLYYEIDPLLEALCDALDDAEAAIAPR